MTIGYAALVCVLTAVAWKTNARPDMLNPLKGDIRVHEPVMIKEGGTYHVYQTGTGIGAKTSGRFTWIRMAGRP